MFTSQIDITNPYDAMRLMRIYIWYRICLGLLLGLSHWSGLAEGIFGSVRPGIFTNITLFYIAAGVVSLLRFRSGYQRTTARALLPLLLIDIFTLAVMIYASGSLTGGLGYLLLIPMAIGSTFLSRKEVITLAAFGTLLLLLIAIGQARQNSQNNPSVFSAGIIGVLLFVTALSFQFFSKKVQDSLQKTKAVTEEANYLQTLNEWVVEALETGIIVIDNQLDIQLINKAAQQFLQAKDSEDQTSRSIFSLSHTEVLQDTLNHWKDDGVAPSPIKLEVNNNHPIRLTFAPLQSQKKSSLVIYLEDLNKVTREAQQLKLASLGRLTANIAHEIRNPLSSVSHASQLLQESEGLAPDDQQLLDMVLNNSQRIDGIINSIIRFSRSKDAQPEIIDIHSWINNFREEYLRLNTGEIEIFFDALPTDHRAKVLIDPTHLYQIISNIVRNGMRHGEQAGGQKRIRLHLSLPREECLAIDIVDFGPGIDDDILDKIFEPFFTTESTGSGLGLYLCKELSIANHAGLTYSRQNHYNKSTFRLSLMTHN